MPADTPNPDGHGAGPQQPDAPADLSECPGHQRRQAEATTRSDGRNATVRLLCLECEHTLDQQQRGAGKLVRCPQCQAEMVVAADDGSEWEGNVLPKIAAGETAARREVLPAVVLRRRRERYWIAAVAVVGFLVWTWWGGWQRSVDAIVLLSLPRDTDAITALTNTQADALVRDRGQKSTTLSFDSLQTLPVEVARILVRNRRGLALDGLTTIPPLDVLRVVASHHGEVSLGGLDALSPGIALALSDYHGEGLSLDGVTLLTPESARAIAASHCMRLSLNGLRTLDEEVAARLSDYRGDLDLDGLAALSDEAAASLSGHKGRSLSLNGLNEISDGAAAALAHYPGSLHLDGIVGLSAEQTRLLRTRKSSPSLSRWRTDTAPQLTTLTVAQAELLLELLPLAYKSYGKPLCLSIQSLTPDVATVLATYPGPLQLDKLTTLSAEQAQPLVDRKTAETKNGSSLSLGIENLTPDAATVLATYPGPLWLNGLRDIPVDAEIALTCRDAELSCRGLTSLKSGQLADFLDARSAPRLEDLRDISPEAASALAKKNGCDLNLSSLVSLSSDVARALGCNKKGYLQKWGFRSSKEARRLVLKGYWQDQKGVRISTRIVIDSADWYCDLLLDGLKEIDPEAAAAVATYGDGTLSLNGLTSLAPEVARALAGHGGRLSLLGLKTLSAEAARELARHQGGVSLGIESLSDESGKAIAGVEGLLLPHLAEVPPGALAAIKAGPGLWMPTAMYTPLERFFWRLTGPILHLVLAAVAVIAASLMIGMALTRRLAHLDPACLLTPQRIKTPLVPTIIATSVLVGLMTFLLMKYLPRQAHFYSEQGAAFLWADYARFDLLLCGFAMGIAMSVAYLFFAVAQRSARSRPLMRPLWTMKPYIRRRGELIQDLLFIPFFGGVVGLLFASSEHFLHACECFPAGLWSVWLAVAVAHVIPWLLSAVIIWRYAKRTFMTKPDAPPTWFATAEGVVHTSRWAGIGIPWSDFASYAWKADHLELKQAGQTNGGGVAMGFVVPPEQRQTAHEFLSARMPGEGEPTGDSVNDQTAPDESPS
jgi:hypothetical protein